MPVGEHTGRTISRVLSSDSHSSRRIIADTLQQPTRTLGGPRQCVLFGLAPNGVWPAAPCCQVHGALLPHLFTLTRAARRRPSAVLLSVPLSVAFPRPAVSRHPALRSPDFPPRMPYAIRGDCLSDLYETRIITQANHNRLTTKKTAYLKIYPFRNIKIQIK